MRAVRPGLDERVAARTERVRQWVARETHLPAWLAAGRRAAARGRDLPRPEPSHPVARLVPLLLVALVAGVDRLIQHVDGGFVLGLLDETAHLATSAIVVGGLVALRLAPTRWFALGLLAGGCLIDLDHVPQLLGATWSSADPALRPYSHSVVTAAAVAGLAPLVRARAPRLAHVLLGAGTGVLVHLARDVAGSPTTVLWPLSTQPVGVPHRWYLLALLAFAAAWARRPGRPAGAGPTLSAPSPRVSRLIVAAASLALVAVVTEGMWRRLDTFRLAGFDTGIFAQGIWLLSHGQTPFVTVRGLGLFADHASFVLLLLAPVYALVPDPRVLLLAQALGMAAPALALNALFLRTGRTWPATVFPLVYLLYPAAQAASTFEFHPETLAPGLLVLGLHLALTRHRPWWVLPIAVALACKEDVGLVVLGIGVLLWTLDRRRRGSIVAATGVVYVALTLAVVMPLVGGGRSIYFQKNYGIDTSESSLAWVPQLPRILEAAFTHATDDAGLVYLMLLLLPVAFLALAAPRWLLPAAGPLFVNLSSKVPELHEITFHYLATASPFIVAAAFHGYLRIGSTLGPARRGGVLAAVLALSLATSATHGPLPKLTAEATAPPAVDVPGVHAVLARIPQDAVVSAGWSLVPSLADRPRLYEFPVPFDKGWWGTGDPPAELRDDVQYVVVLPKTLRDMDRAAYARLAADPEWEPVVRRPDVVLLQKRGS